MYKLKIALKSKSPPNEMKGTEKLSFCNFSACDIRTPIQELLQISQSQKLKKRF